MVMAEPIRNGAIYTEGRYLGVCACACVHSFVCAEEEGKNSGERSNRN
jgi:hypothetical protein